MAQVLDVVEILLEGINPVPWSAPNVGRTHGYSSSLLRDYKAAIRESLMEGYPDHPTFEKGALLTMEVWFSRDTGFGAKEADSTNVLKATEDALQATNVPLFRGLFHNDKHNRRVSCEGIFQQDGAEPIIAIKVSRWQNYKSGIFEHMRFVMPAGPPIPGNVRLQAHYKEQ